jgi:hypothetical protein
LNRSIGCVPSNPEKWDIDMQGFTYKYGDRPLAGYTIQRAAGRGGFGEVYYALSDSGREVALKVVQGFQDIELRGISQCMNLKSPHLVTIFDVRHNDQDKPFVLMEFVAGPSLRELIDESPAGLGVQKTAFFLREIAKGLTYLHDRGIVHRDLKPGNVFYEDGYVKIGDYGLSKAISASKHSGQTITVGTVHYMAPEIGQGRYDRSIDIYAMGCMLYEMLTGQTPFLGGSTGEILMKHLVKEPKLEGIDEPFASAIRKAMAKDPKDRFQTVQEMVEAVFGAQHIQQSVSCFSPDNLTMVADRVARKVTAGGPGSSGQVDIGQPSPRTGAGQGGDFVDRLGEKMDRIGERLGAAGEQIGRKFERVGERIDERMRGLGAAADRPAPPPAPLDALPVDPRRDPMGKRARTILYLVTAALLAGGTAFFSSQGWGGQFPNTWFASFMTILGAVAGLSMAAYWLEPRLQRETGFVRHLAYGGLACVWAAFLDIGPVLMAAGSGGPSAIVTGHYGTRHAIMTEHYLTGTALSIAIVLLLTNWSKIVNPARRERIALGPAFYVGGLGFVANLFFDGNTPFIIGTLAGIAMAVQACSPFDPLAVRGPRKPRTHKLTVEASRDQDKSQPETRAEPQRWEYTSLRQDPVQEPSYPASAFDNFMMAFEYPRIRPRLLSMRTRAILLVSGFVLLGLGLAIILGVLTSSLNTPSSVVGIFLGLSSLAVSFVPLLVGLWGKRSGVWTTFVRPIISEALLAVALTAFLTLLGIVCGRLGPQDSFAAVLLIVFPLVVAVILNLLPARWSRSTELEQAKVPGWQTPPPLPQAAGSESLQSTEPGSGPIEMRPTSWPPDPRASQFQSRPRPQGTNPFLAAPGLLLMLLAMVSGMVGTLSQPALTALAAFDKNPPSWFDSVMNGSWQGILDSLEMALSAGFMFLAALVLIVARRWAGGAHMLRVILGAIGLLGSLQLVRLALSFERTDWAAKVSLVQHGYYQEVLRELLGRVSFGGIVLAALTMLGSVLILAWPPRRQEQMPVVGKGV